MRLPLIERSFQEENYLIMDYYCTATSCTYKGEGPYVLSLPPEACIDENNCAIVFCPYCQSQMVIKQPISNGGDATQ
jgi:hypothetical protein